MKGVVEKLESNKAQLGRYYHLFTVMFLNGTRISETLRLSYQDVIVTGEVFMVSDKGSANRLLNTGVSSSYMLECKSNNVDPFFRMNRYQAYRILKGLGIGLLKSGRKHESVTHSFRNEYAKRLRGIGLSGRELSNLTGHKVTKNTEYYGKD